MTKEQMLAEIKAMIEQIEDERFLRVLLAFVQAWEKEYGDPVIGYEADGSPVRASAARAQFAEDLSKPEELMSIEDVEKELNQVTA